MVDLSPEGLIYRYIFKSTHISEMNGTIIKMKANEQ